MEKKIHHEVLQIYPLIAKEVLSGVNQRKCMPLYHKEQGCILEIHEWFVKKHLLDKKYEKWLFYPISEN